MGRLRVRTMVVLAACVVVATGLPAITSAAGAAPPPDPVATANVARDPGSSPAYQATLAQYATQALDWFQCYDDEFPEFQCAFMTVPADWARPNKGEIQVLITRILATGERRGILQTNPGGPGGNGFWMPLYLEDAEPEVAEHYDLIGMDPRGVYASTELDCQGTDTLSKLYALDGQDRSPANSAKFLKFSKGEAEECAADPLTKYISTDQTVRDLDLVRALFGEQKFSWLGYSAGTWMGAWYATLFPSHVDRFVLDGNTDFTTSWYESFKIQPGGFQRRFEEDLIPWLAQYDDLLHLGKNAMKVRRTYDNLRDKLARRPLTLADGSQLTGAGLDSAVAGELYASFLFPELANALSILPRYATATPEEQDAVTAVFGDVPLDQSEHVFWSVVCNDTAAVSQARFVADWASITYRYPLTGASYLADPCQFWKIKPTGSPVTGRGIPPLLMIQNDGDPATPYAGGLAAHRNTPNSVLLTVRHEGDHTIYGNGDECVEAIANDWLVNGNLPRRDKTCEGQPLPDLAAGATARPAVATATAVPAQVFGDQFVAAHGVPQRR